MQPAMVMAVVAVLGCPGSLWAQSTPAQEAPRLSRARLLTGAGLLIGGTAMLAAASQDKTLPRDDRRLLVFQGVGSLGAGALTLALPSRESPAAAEEPADATEEPSRRKLWTGVGLTIGGSIFLAQSVLFFSGGCGEYNQECRSQQMAFRVIGGALTVSGVSLIVIHGAEKRRAARVALWIAPRNVSVNVSF